MIGIKYDYIALELAAICMLLSTLSGCGFHKDTTEQIRKLTNLTTHIVVSNSPVLPENLRWSREFDKESAAQIFDFLLANSRPFDFEYDANGFESFSIHLFNNLQPLAIIHVWCRGEDERPKFEKLKALFDEYSPQKLERELEGGDTGPQDTAEFFRVVWD